MKGEGNRDITILRFDSRYSMLVVIQLPHWTPFVRVTADILVNDYYGLTSYLVDAVSIQMIRFQK